MTASKNDLGKPRMELISSKFLVGLAKVLTHGAKKYAAHNWRKGLAYSRVYGALQRHLAAWNDGEDLDAETGLSHLYHAACELMFLAEFAETRPDLDDRWKAEPTVVRGGGESRHDVHLSREDLCQMTAEQVHAALDVPWEGRDEEGTARIRGKA